MNITVISDTQGLHHQVKIDVCDLLIHCGDITEYGTEEEVIDFVKWFDKQNAKYKIFIAGNHDLFFENVRKKQLKKLIPPSVIYLQNNSVTINNINIYGSPVSPYFLGMAFNKKRGNEIKKVWSKITHNTNILITHTPAFGILDNNLGCEDLLSIVNIIKPQFHLFGHIHCQNGLQQKNATTFINAALTNNLNDIETTEYSIIAKPINFIL